MKLSPPNYQLIHTLDHILFPKIKPYKEGHLKVSKVHQIWYGEYGNPQGLPVVVVHGGPGAGCSPQDMRFFDPTFYRIILFDQRASGRSAPLGEMEGNTPQDSIQDMEKLREHLCIEKWLLFGGSWGTALSIAYGEAHSVRCLGFILRGIFLGRQADYEQVWYGMRDIYPEVWQEFVEFLPPHERANLIAAYYRRFMDSDPAINMSAARAFLKYDMLCATLINQGSVANILQNDAFVLAVSRTFTHYSMNKFFLEPNQLLDNLKEIAHLPAIIVHGRYDVICRAKTAFELHNHWPKSKLVFVQDAGHASSEPGIAKELVAATEEMKIRNVA
ncbi:MAG: proline iminopeptidase [Alphaproteobacteria bacterium]|nr:proline iminopeptidase [Alphaproteobacteria bacterium]